ncbi:polysaccharide biosynthesis/export family protein [Sphingomonas immobilis]|uniref:Polysaccharide biosynthesis/export family protein n=1 Tax=Sphingomonas immobilis TaxID=3063997 RepID=A0ABT9A441_9SPHN|nr:polysaccharide biosynthesis/export family protein [Sphingomonas sp. CA1-15]MDO7844603.1 polysaccharide biosynthesis/export family protein [Sphingomonas sp. CA1-15]
MARIWLILFFAVLFAPAGAFAQKAAEAPPAPSAAVQAAADNGSPDYVLGVADRVRITVYNETQLTGEFPVNSNGFISFPLIGDVRAQGLTATELARGLEKKLGDGYLIDPRISIDVLTFRPFYILGEVSKSGEYPYSSGLTVVNAIAKAEGFTYRANKKYVFLKRAGTTEEQRIRLTSHLLVQPGDTIRIGERLF